MSPKGPLKGHLKPTKSPPPQIPQKTLKSPLKASQKPHKRTSFRHTKSPLKGSKEFSKMTYRIPKKDSQSDIQYLVFTKRTYIQLSMGTRVSQSYIVLCRKCSKSCLPPKIPLFGCQKVHQVKNFKKILTLDTGPSPSKFMQCAYVQTVFQRLVYD